MMMVVLVEWILIILPETLKTIYLLLVEGTELCLLQA